MLRLLCPQWVFDNYEAVTPDFLRAHGVKLLLADLDYHARAQKSSQRAGRRRCTRWIGALKAGGHRPFADFVEQPQPACAWQRFCAGRWAVDFVGHAQKPSRSAAFTRRRRAGRSSKRRRSIRRCSATSCSRISLGAKRSGVLALMVEPKRRRARVRGRPGAPCPAGAVQGARARTTSARRG